MPDESHGIAAERIVLGRSDAMTMVGFQWTGAEPEGLNDLELATHLGARWEDDELVTYNLKEFFHEYERHVEGYMEDPD